MMKQMKLLRDIKREPLHFLVALCIGASFSLLGYLIFFQTNFFSRTFTALSLLILVGSTLIVFSIHRTLLPKVKSLPKWEITFSVVAVLLSVLFLLINVYWIPVYGLLPQAEVKITLEPLSAVAQDQTVTFLNIQNPLGYIHYSNLEFDGSWQQDGKSIRIDPRQAFSIAWRGRVGESLQVRFKPTEYDQFVTIRAGEERRTFNLRRDSLESDVLYAIHFEIPLIYKIPFALAFLIAVSFALFAFLVFQVGRVERLTVEGARKPRWYLYPLPLILTSFITLLVFWPGIMSRDSMSQWQVALTGQNLGWHPFVHTLLIRLLVHIWDSPAMIAIFQILFTAGVFAWGMRFLEARRVPAGILWSLSFIFAFWPLTPIMMVTLWEDVLYGASLLALFIISLEIAWSDGRWVEQKAHMLWVIVAALLTAFFKRNGIAVSLITLGTWAILYKEQRRRFLFALWIFLSAWALVEFPLKGALDDRGSSQGSQANLILLSHIAAHVENETPLKVEEEDYLNGLLPLDDWEYYCCYVGTVSYDEDFARSDFMSQFPKNLNLALDLFVRDPLVDVRHRVCAGEMMWRFLNNQCMMKTPNGFHSVEPGRVKWIQPNNLGIQERSRLPGLVQPYVQYLRSFGFFSNILIPVLRPALYAFLATLAGCAAALRTRKGGLLAALIPLLSQTAVLFLIAFSPSFRYQYGICLMGIFSLGLFCIRKDSA